MVVTGDAAVGEPPLESSAPLTDASPVVVVEPSVVVVDPSVVVVLPSIEVVVEPSAVVEVVEPPAAVVVVVLVSAAQLRPPGSDPEAVNTRCTFQYLFSCVGPARPSVQATPTLYVPGGMEVTKFGPSRTKVKLGRPLTRPGPPA